jgi:phosphoenolpyruvate carboxykinase (GTP)
LGDYIQNHLDFGEFVPKAPRIFAVNYFLKDEAGNYLNAKEDKRIWLQWMDLRIHKEADAIRTPTGYIPLYSDLKRLFETYLGKEYSEEDYETQFAVRVPELIAKTNRIHKTYQDSVEHVPDILYRLLGEQQERLEEAREKFGDVISPAQFL